MRRGQEAVHDLREGIRRGILLEGGDLFRRGRQAGEIEGGAAQQIELASGLDLLEALLFQVREDKAIDGGLGPAGVLHGGRLGIFERL